MFPGPFFSFPPSSRRREGTILLLLQHLLIINKESGNPSPFFLVSHTTRDITHIIIISYHMTSHLHRRLRYAMLCSSQHRFLHPSSSSSSSSSSSTDSIKVKQDRTGGRPGQRCGRSGVLYTFFFAFFVCLLSSLLVLLVLFFSVVFSLPVISFFCDLQSQVQVEMR
ncbi:hypothetical protein VTN02DRAFT_2602 [Thermoascus thermophilus]